MIGKYAKRTKVNMKDLFKNISGFEMLPSLFVLFIILVCLAVYIISHNRPPSVTINSSSKNSVTTQTISSKTASTSVAPVQILKPLTSGSSWDGHAWYITDGGMAGVIPGNPANVLIDQNGYLHLRITKSGNSYSSAELFSTDSIGFGTYQWQLQGSLNSFAPQTVVGLFLYGPQNNVGVDGENEIDVEFSQWDKTLCDGTCNADFTVYPATGNAALGQTEDDYTDSRSGEPLTTARVTWNSTSVTETVMNGLEPLGTTANVIHSWTFAPTDYHIKIPQQPLPIAMNLWSFNQPPTENQEVIIRDFQYLPQ